MPRRPRIQYPGAVYHVLDRGDRKEPIFHGVDDRNLFLHTLEEACTRSEAFVHGMVLMKNHYHLELETPHGNLAETMHWFQGTYTQRFNLRHELVGHLFQGRYKAIPIDPSDPSYFLRVSNYIHLNPVRAGLLNPLKDSLESYEWSSFPYIIGEQNHKQHWLKKERVLRALGVENDEDGRLFYKQYLHQRAIDVYEDMNVGKADSYSSSFNDGYVGGDRFSKWLKKYQEDVSGELKDQSGRKRLVDGVDDAESILEEALLKIEMSLEDVQSLRPSASLKQIVAWWLKSESGIKARWIASRLKMGDPSNVSRACTAMREDNGEEIKRLKIKFQ